MNIFATNQNPAIAAIDLDDKRLRKMAVETCQILSTALRNVGINDDRLYKSYNPNGRFVKWALRNEENWNWLCLYAGQLFVELNFREFKVPERIANIIMLSVKHRWVSDVNLDKIHFERCEATRKMNGISTIEAYRELLRVKWDGSEPRWTNRKAPGWYK